MLADAILNVHNQVSGSILITSSRRTGKEAEDIIMKKIGHIPAYTYLWGEKKDNPIMGFYACADRIIVTGDSVSMACEACGLGKAGTGFPRQKLADAETSALCSIALRRRLCGRHRRI